MKKTFSTLLAVIILGLILPVSSVFAAVGVGIGTGKIEIDKPINKGGIYDLPPVSVVNKGDEISSFNLGIEYHEAQPELMPERGWFSFSPAEFQLEPGNSQVVEVNLNIPLNAKPGKYFAYLEARPIQGNNADGSTSIGIAAASKLYFTVNPNNVIEAVYYRLISLWKQYEPWTTFVAVALALISVYFIGKKYLKVSVSLGRNNGGSGNAPQTVVPSPTQPSTPVTNNQIAAGTVIASTSNSVLDKPVTTPESPVSSDTPVVTPDMNRPLETIPASLDTSASNSLPPLPPLPEKKTDAPQVNINPIVSEPIVPMAGNINSDVQNPPVGI